MAKKPSKAELLQGTLDMLILKSLVGGPRHGYAIAQWIAAPGVDPGTLVPYSPQMYDAAAYESMRAFRKPFAVVHLYSFYALVVMVVLHIAAVVVTEVREGGSIVSAMFTGRKIVGGRPEDEDAAR